MEVVGLVKNDELFLVYKTTNLITGKFYIGQHIASELEDSYLGSGKIIRQSIKKHGRENFRREVLEFCDSLNHLNEREIFWIKELDARNPKVGYNIVIGGSGLGSGENHPCFNKVSSVETKRKISESHTGRKASEETRKKLSESHKGFVKSEKSILKFIESRKGYTHSAETVAKIQSSREGYQISEETKDKIRKANTGKVRSEEVKDRIRTTLKNQPEIMCPHCDFIGKVVSAMNRYHFENCKQNPDHTPKEIICPHCGVRGTSASNMKRWHFDNCKSRHT